MSLLDEIYESEHLICKGLKEINDKGELNKETLSMMGDLVDMAKDVYEIEIGESEYDYIKTDKASYVTWDDTFQKLFVGYFDTKNLKDFYMNSYDLDGKESKEKIILPLKTQGVSIGVYKGKTYCICSCSYNKYKPSSISIAEMKKIDGKNEETTAIVNSISLL